MAIAQALITISCIFKGIRSQSELIYSFDFNNISDWQIEESDISIRFLSSSDTKCQWGSVTNYPCIAMEGYSEITRNISLSGWQSPYLVMGMYRLIRIR